MSDIDVTRRWSFQTGSDDLHTSAQPFALRLTARLGARLWAVSLLAIALTVAVGSTIPGSIISLALKQIHNPSERYATLHLMDARSGLVVRVSDQSVACCTVWSPDGARIAFNNLSGQPFVWDARDGKTHPLAPPEFQAWVSAWSPSGDSIVAAGYGAEQAGFELYLLSAEGDRQTRLTAFKGVNVHHPGWSPDGHFIIFSAGADATSAIYRIDPDGENFQPLMDKGNGFAPRISPDGQQIAYLAMPDSDTELFIVNMDGSAGRRLTWTDASEGAPRWSPDGTRFLFQAYVNDDFPRVLDIMNTDGTGRQRLTDYTSFAGLPSWSPDGRHILYEVQKAGAGAALYVMDADGSNVRLLLQDELTVDFMSVWQPQP